MTEPKGCPDIIKCPNNPDCECKTPLMQALLPYIQNAYLDLYVPDIIKDIIKEARRIKEANESCMGGM